MMCKFTEQIILAFLLVQFLISISAQHISEGNLEASVVGGSVISTENANTFVKRTSEQPFTDRHFERDSDFPALTFHDQAHSTERSESQSPSNNGDIVSEQNEGAIENFNGEVNVSSAGEAQATEEHAPFKKSASLSKGDKRVRLVDITVLEGENNPKIPQVEELVTDSNTEESSNLRQSDVIYVKPIEKETYISSKQRNRKGKSITYEGDPGDAKSHPVISHQNIPEYNSEEKFSKKNQTADLSSINETSESKASNFHSKVIIDSINLLEDTARNKSVVELNIDIVKNSESLNNSNSSKSLQDGSDSKNSTSEVTWKLYQENLVLKALLHHIASKYNTTLSLNGFQKLNNSISTVNSNSTEVEIEVETPSENVNSSIKSHFEYNNQQESNLTIDGNRLVHVNASAVNEYIDDVNYNYYARDYEDYPVTLDKASTKREKSLNTAYYTEPQPIDSSADELLNYDFHPEFSSTVRKCCSPTQYFNVASQDCTDVETPVDMKNYLHDLILGNDSDTLLLKSGILVCPNPEESPSISRNISSYSHLLDQGFLYDVETQTHYSHDLYCLELIGDNSSASDLSVVYCPQYKNTPHLSKVRKCCPVDQYFDGVLSKCVPNFNNDSLIESLVQEFSRTFSNDTTIEIGTLSCQQGNLELADAGTAYFSHNDQLCVSPTDRCYPSSLHCIEYILPGGEYEFKPAAAYCPLDSFQKCCAAHEFMKEGVCTSTNELHSPYITQLMATLHFQVGAPQDNPEDCVQLLLDNEVRWWITNSGFLAINTESGFIETKKYCVEDWVEPNEQIVTGAYVCSKKLKESVALPITMFEEGTIGKCCPPGRHLSPSSLICVDGNSGQDLREDKMILDNNVTKIGYTGLPICDGYISYSFVPGDAADDFAQFDSNLVLNAVSLDGKCIERMTPLLNENFCIDYGWDANDPEILTALVCAPQWAGENLHTEKYNLVAALLGVSCISLLIALFTLATMRVRRGLVSTRKMNTLAGRIQMSYLSAHIVGFLTLAISMHIDVKEDNRTTCMVLAGVMQYFLLSGFFWNTSICSESLFLTIRRVNNISERVRYAFHSLWAWGVPALITALCLLIDHFRHDLPCTTIAPKIGTIKCFFSNPDAELVYFYLPIAITLVANLVLLLTSKYARLFKLKKLEKNKPKIPTGNTVRTRKNGVHIQDPPSNVSSSGLRTHQNRNMVSESLRLVLWSGGTWLFEVIGFITARYISAPQERWYDYLWYIPASINSLRGFGIFYILVLTPENRTKIYRALGTFKGMSNRVFSSEASQSVDSVSHNYSMSMKSSGYNVRNPHAKQRNMSVLTNVTNVTQLNQNSSDPQKTHARLIHSISQIERRPSVESSQSCMSEAEDLENRESSDATGRRRSSAVAISLPSVDEEDDGVAEGILSINPNPCDSSKDSRLVRQSSIESET